MGDRPADLRVSFDLEDPVLAAVAWARIAEPADKRAGELVAAVGPVEGLRWVLEGRSRLPVPESLRVRPRGWLERAARLDPVREVGLLTRLGGVVLHPADPRWPASLTDLGLATPHCLWVRGDPALAAAAYEGGVAIVGARAATAYGEHVAGELVAALAGEGRVIVSGGAYGIDAVAHRVALAVGGATVAVMAGGLDRMYPAGNSELLERVARDGAVVAEVPPGSSPSRSRFLTRNRLIAALASGCVVVEAGWRSGTLSTANHAAELCRPVGAVPGPVTSAASAGCHRLLRDGQAVCVTDAADVRQLLGPIGSFVADEVAADAARDAEAVRATDVPSGLGPREARVWEALPARGAALLESLARASGLGESETRAAAGRLELFGYVVREGDRFRRVSRG